MSDSQKTEELVLQVLLSQGSALDAAALVTAVQRLDSDAGEWEIKKAVWRLTADEKAEFTGDFQVRLPAALAH